MDSTTTGLRGCTQSRIITDVLQKTAATAASWLVLIVDTGAMRTISSCSGMYDLMECRITTVENLGAKRQPLPELEAVYLVTPSVASVEAICKDFEGNKDMYGKVRAR